MGSRSKASSLEEWPRYTRKDEHNIAIHGSVWGFLLVMQTSTIKNADEEEIKEHPALRKTQRRRCEDCRSRSGGRPFLEPLPLGHLLYSEL